MNAVVVYQSKYGATKKYAQWIAESLSCDIKENKNLKAEVLLPYDTIIYGGGLYAESIAGVGLITKHLSLLEGKKLIVYTTGLTPVTCREYYDKLVAEKNFKGDSLSKIKVYHFPGRMFMNELSFVHKTAIKTLKKIISGKENPTEMEKLLLDLCDTEGDFTDKNALKNLLAYVSE
ncbi:flavodoxin domain-containing protein [Ructibacterium gallinarum]|uniref:Flavodoxin n=1 Tax=Ructibacterium gallinarum TaxID=2779355 RepID=A0A9D5R8K6_9FIRM|nr:flavodoxin domain-containing protein [Ructibacterium gallinarum]MBE5039534.1 flavodoxin [Ructibacterium gallinarum]